MDHGIEFSDPSILEPPQTIKSVFGFAKGDTGLTEAMIYQAVSADGIPVFGGGKGVPRFRAAKTLHRSSGDKATVFSGPALVVSMDGSSGSIQVIEDAEFSCNHFGAVLTPKLQTNLWCFAQITEPALWRLASNNSGSATLTTPALGNLVVRVPTGSIATEIEKHRRVLVGMSRLA